MKNKHFSSSRSDAGVFGTVQPLRQDDLDRANALLMLRPPVHVQRSHPVLYLVDDDGNAIE